MSTRTDKYLTEQLRLVKDWVGEYVQDNDSTAEDGRHDPVPAGTTMVIPEPKDLDLDGVATFARGVRDYAERCDDIAELDDIRARLTAIETYLARRNEKAVRALAATERRLEVRIGVLLGPAKIGGDRRSDQVGRDQPDRLTKDQRHDFRKMAQHMDNVDVANAVKGGASRAEVLRRIDAATQKQPVDPKPSPAPTPADHPRAIADAVRPPPPQIIETTAVEQSPLDRLREAVQRIEAPPGLTQPPSSSSIVTEADRTLARIAQALDRADPDHLATSDLRPWGASMAASLTRIGAFVGEMMERTK